MKQKSELKRKSIYKNIRIRGGFSFKTESKNYEAMVVEEVVKAHVIAWKEEHIGTTAEEGASPAVNTKEQEQADIKADEVTSSIKTGDRKTEHNIVDQKAFASVVRTQEEVSANVSAAKDTALKDMTMTRTMGRFRRRIFALLLLCIIVFIALLAIFLRNGVQGSFGGVKAHLCKALSFLKIANWHLLWIWKSTIHSEIESNNGNSVTKSEHSQVNVAASGEGSINDTF